MKKFACLFPGQGSQAVGMGQAFFERSEIARELFRKADDALEFPLSRLCFEGPEEDLRLTRNTQPALLVVSVIAYTLLDRVPAVAAGHSLGEYSALTAAGALRFEDAVRLVHKRGCYMQEAVLAGTGAMAAVLGADPDKLRETLSGVSSGVVEIANWNSREQTVISGHKEAVAEALRLLAPCRGIPLPVSAPFHTSLMKPAEDRLSEDLDATGFSDLQFPVIANVDASVVRTGDEAREALRRQVSRPVLWIGGMETLRSFDVEFCIEPGIGKVLSGLWKRIGRAWPASPDIYAVEDWDGLEKARSLFSD
ncbi:MAG: ACP S-malonyltransferase [Acidobacteriota bacterium]|nr:ACP S-malonyltransferase [Acidobacteriota bacterium]